MNEPEEHGNACLLQKGLAWGLRVRKALGLLGRALSIMVTSWVLSQPVAGRLMQSLLIALILGMIGEPFTTLFL